MDNLMDGSSTHNLYPSISHLHNTDDTPCNVLVMNLPFRARWQDLKDLCRQACHIDRADVALEADGRSRGYGEVTCPSRAEAQRLFRMFDGFEWQGRKLSIILVQSGNQESTSRLRGQPFSQNVASFDPAHLTYAQSPSSTLMHPQVQTDDRVVFVGNLPFAMLWQDLKDLLRPAGRVVRTDVSMGKDGRSRGWGTAQFLTSEEARSAVAMFDDMEIDGRRIRIRLDKLGGRGSPRTQPQSSPLSYPDQLQIPRQSHIGPSMLAHRSRLGSGNYPLQQNTASSYQRTMAVPVSNSSLYQTETGASYNDQHTRASGSVTFRNAQPHRTLRREEYEDSRLTPGYGRPMGDEDFSNRNFNDQNRGSDRKIPPTNPLDRYPRW